MASLVVDVSSHLNLGSSFSKIREVNWLISLPCFSVTRTTFQDEIPWGWLVGLGFPELWWDQCGAEAREKVGSCCSCKSGLTFPVLPQGPTARCHSQVMEHGNRMYAASRGFTGLDCP